MTSALKKILMNSYKDQMISYMNDHPECFDEGLELAISDNQPYAWRSAWLLWSCMKEDDERVKHKLEDIISAIDGKKDGHQRELLKILLKMDLTEEQEGRLFIISVDIWEKIGRNPSVRFTAFQFILKMAKKYPELLNEIEFFMQDHYVEPLSPGIRRSVFRKLREILDGEKPENP
jgi:hypothetical protein